MAQNIAQKAVESTSKTLLASVFSSMGKVAREAAGTIFPALVRTGSPLVKDLAGTIEGGLTSRKGLQEKVSRWLKAYDFATPVRDWLWKEGAALVGPDTVVAVDSGDISKEFGGAGMEGMEMGYDASRGVTAMGHALLCAAIVLRSRATAWRLSLLKGRKGLRTQETALFDEIVAAVGPKGVLAFDRGFDSEAFISHVWRGAHRAVVRVKTLTRDLFGTGQGLEEAFRDAPAVATRLRSPTSGVDAIVRWRTAFFPGTDGHLPVLLVSSTVERRTIFLYALHFADENATQAQLREAACKAAEAYYRRWGVEVLFQDVKECFGVERARVKSFRGLENLLAFCTLAHGYLAHRLPESGQAARLIYKTMRDTLGDIVENFRPFVANLRELLRMERTKFITGRPRKAKPPDRTPVLPFFPT